MDVRAICWMGVQTERFEEMRRLFGSLLGAERSGDEAGVAVWDLPSGDLIELFAAGEKPTFGSAPVVGFLVDDLDASRRAVESAGGEIVSGYGPNEDGYEAVHFRAPDGNVYEIVRDPIREMRAREPASG